MIVFEDEIRQLINADESALPPAYDLSGGIEVMNSLLSKIGKKQTAISMQVEEIYEFTQQNEETQQASTDVENMLRAVIALGDIVEDFYRYASGSENNISDALRKQSEIMWKLTGKNMGLAGIVRIDDVGILFDPAINTVEETANLPDLPHGLILAVLKCGYLKNGKLIRKSRVIANVAATEEVENG